ncbi:MULTISPECIES: flagellar basal body rod C-terminal domain-containing protein [Helicobacter]|uniref:Flagellar basal-body/hook protein C-terminal domain-containing protein n=1 Tax=Helicobacter ibis TaxID=2962633 RepID=A0ABT4VD96_9HELI|nr:MULTISPECIES: flagellar basal body rod C-terminal domain-containing protein [Helicobacter]MDA3967263.1 hypothetical protein [Helicobacter sp. WB40]MDA3968669.1 hypothetical protein [Helicobacter ibis]
MDPISSSQGYNPFGSFTSPSTGVRSGALETSNTDISEEMVNNVVNENATKANAQAIQTQDNMMQSALDILA